MRRHGALVALTLALLAATLALAACGGDGETTERPTPAGAPGGSPAMLPPQFVECMAEQGVDVEASPELIHSPQGDACFESLHGGGVP